MSTSMGFAGSGNHESKTSSYGSIQGQGSDIEKSLDPPQTTGNSSGDRNNRRRIVKASFGCLMLLAMIVAVCFQPWKEDEDSDGGGMVRRFPILTTAEDNRNTSTGSATITTESSSATAAANESTEIPFPHIDRSTFGKNPVPPSSIVDPNLFSPSLRGDNDDNGDDGQNRFLKVPFPTGAFWTNLVTEPTSDRLLSYPIMAYPYGFKWNPEMIQVSLPSLRRLMDSVSIRDIFNPDLTLMTMESVKQRHVQSFDPLSVTLRFQTTESSSSSSDDYEYWETYIVQGSPYITARYQHMVPIIRALSTFRSISCLNDSDCKRLEEEDTDQQPSHLVRLKGTQFVIQTMENLTWMLFVSEPNTTIVFNTIGSTQITTEGKFNGVLRLALLPPPQKDLDHYTNSFEQTYQSTFHTVGENDSNDDEPPSAMKMLIQHSRVYPIGADVSWGFPSKDVGTVRFDFKTKSFRGMNLLKGGDSDLLMLALPHHVDVLSANDDSKEYKIIREKEDFDLIYRTIKGHMTPVIGSTWEYKEQLTTVGFDSKNTLEKAAELSHKTKTTILDQVALDVKRVLPTLDENIYGYGKQTARLAQLIHIAKVLLDTEDDTSSLSQKYGSVIEESQEALYAFLVAFLSGTTADPLVYDTNFGGLVTQDGLDDSMNDFGNGWYNDHHFHYGYQLYACALMGQWNETFVTEYGPVVDAVMYDVAHSSYASSSSSASEGGAFFPFARHKAWFDGHSFASGLFRFASGKSMESSSESINCYYGAYLWSMVRGKDSKTKLLDHQTNFARLLLATEIRGIKTYWHMMPKDENSPIAAGLFNPMFAKNLMVGNLGMMDATVSTWFGNNPLYVHMINLMPVTAITRQLFDNSYLEKEFSSVIQPIYQNVEMAWKGYVICDRAMLEPIKAWKDALELRSYELDQAVSQSQVLYFASTMQDFEDQGEDDASSSEESDNDTHESADFAPSSSSSSSSLCIDHSECASLGLAGHCCPPSPGQANLGCCDSDSTSPSEKESLPTTTTTKPGESALCSNNAGCATAGLTGYCCPAINGAHLSCCNET